MDVEPNPAWNAVGRHWPEYAMEAAGLGLFMVSACLAVALLEHSASPIHRLVADPFLRRALTGAAMGLTAIALVYSPWGKRSGAHFNPAVTLTFFRLGKIEPWDALFYLVAQFAGAAAGVAAAGWLLGSAIIADPAVNFVATLPGGQGSAVAFAAEVAISFGLMLTVLFTSNAKRLNRFTGIFAGLLVAAYITWEAPLSGMSMNPARSFGSALSARRFAELWIYFTAPLVGMLLAAELYRRIRGDASILCCKLHHENDERCIFRCRYGAASAARPAAVPARRGGHRTPAEETRP